MTFLSPVHLGLCQFWPARFGPTAVLIWPARSESDHIAVAISGAISFPITVVRVTFSIEKGQLRTSFVLRG